MGKHSTFKVSLLVVLLCVCGVSMCAVWLYVCNGTHLEVKGQLVGVDSSTVWAMKIELRSLGLPASAFTY